MIDFEKMSPLAKDIDKAITSIREELDAINVYNMRAEQAEDPELRALLIHNRDEEIEHAAMLLEWMRRNIKEFDKEFKDYLFTEGSILNKEAEITSGGEKNKSGLGIGSLK